MFLDAVEAAQAPGPVVGDPGRAEAGRGADRRKGADDRPAPERGGGETRRAAGAVGHGRDSWFTQPENQLEIIRRLPSGTSRGSPTTSTAHSQLDRFAAVFPKMLPHLMAVNLNGMRAEGPMILPIGEGDREQEMIAIIHKSGYRGAVGLLHHQRTMDAATGLSQEHHRLAPDPDENRRHDRASTY